MKLKVLSLFATILFTVAASAQYTWSDIGTSTFLTTISNGSNNSTTTVGGVTNPNPSGINTTATTNQFDKHVAANSHFKVTLANPILAADVASTIIKIKIYFAEFDDLPNTSLRMYLGEAISGNDNRKTITLAFDEANEGIWTEYEFNFSTIDPDGVFNTQYDEFKLFFNQGADDIAATYYFDGISGNADQQYTLSPASAELTSDNQWYYNYSPDTFAVTITNGGANSVLTPNQATPSVIGNDSPTVSKYTKDVGSASGNIKFTFPNEIFEVDKAKAIFKIRIYIPATATGNSLRMNIRKTGEVAGTTQITHTLSNASMVVGRWQEYTFDFSGTEFKHTSYDHALIFLIDGGDTSGNPTNDYYFDALQGLSLAAMSVEHINDNNSNLSILPTLVEDSFTLSEKIQSAVVYDISGQIVKNYGNQSVFEAADLAPGIYFLNAKLNDGISHSIRFVKK